MVQEPAIGGVMDARGEAGKTKEHLEMVKLDRGVYRIERLLDEDARVYLRGKRANKDVEWMINDILIGIKIMGQSANRWMWLAFFGLGLVAVLIVLLGG